VRYGSIYLLRKDGEAYAGVSCRGGGLSSTGSVIG
jgi:hypothetical protein